MRLTVLPVEGDLQVTALSSLAFPATLAGRYGLSPVMDPPGAFATAIPKPSWPRTSNLTHGADHIPPGCGLLCEYDGALDPNVCLSLHVGPQGLRT